MIRYLAGLVLLAVAVVPVALASREWRRRIAPALDGPVATLADVVLVLAAMVVLAELLGTVHLLRLAPVTVVFAGTGLVAWRAARRGGPAVQPVRPGPTSGSGGGPVPEVHSVGSALAVVATAILTAGWAARTVDAYRHGMSTPDTLWYHMPFAARFVQTGSTTALHYLDSTPVTVFYPANSELLHALGIVFMGNDLLSPALNMAWMAMGLLAAWCVGRPFGVAPVTLVGACVLLGTPGMVATQPGGAYTDVVSLALFLASVALLIHADREGRIGDPAMLAVAALAAGLAIGTKFTLVAPIGLLTVGVVVLCRRGRRLRDGGLWLGLVVLTGGYWYLRNLVTIGNPLPSLSRIGPIHLPSPPIGQPNTTVAHYLLDGSIWRRFFLPGLRSSLGPAWWAILALAAAGAIILLIEGRSNVHRMLSLLALGSGAAFLVTPQFLGIPGAPIFFVYNVRYSAPAVLLGLVLLPLAPHLARGRRPLWIGGVFVLVLAVTQLDPTIWPSHLFAKPFSAPLDAGESVAGVVVGLLVLAAGAAIVARGRIRAPRLRPVPVVLGALLLVAVLGFPLQQFYRAHRYVGAPVVQPDPKVVAWAQGVHGARIAIVGPFAVGQYPYYGQDVTNYVQYVERVLPNGALAPYPDCAAWRRALHVGHYSYLISGSLDETNWIRSDPGSRVVMTEANHGIVIFTVFALNPRLDLSHCEGSRAAA